MTPGAKAIYDLIVERNAHYANINVKVQVTRSVLNDIYEKEVEEINEFFKTISAQIAQRFPLAKNFCSHSALSSVVNDMENGIQHYLCSQGWWKIDPLNGTGVVLTYDDFMEKLGISKDVAKNCIEYLIRREIISRSRQMGGFAYSVKAEAIVEAMLRNPGKWTPQYFNPETMSYEEDESLWEIVNAAQNSFGPIQAYYERSIEKACAKPSF